MRLKHTLYATVFGVQTLLLSAAASFAADTPLALMPLPQSVVAGGGTLEIGPALEISWKGKPSPLLERAAERFTTALHAVTGLRETPGAKRQKLTITAGDDPAFLSTGEREHYHLVVDQSGIALDADGPAGVLDGLSTLLQLVQVQGGTAAALPYVTIDDKPRFVWRGIMIDTARHFMSVPTVERQIDAMERVKLNVLHMHLSDAQGFRVESHALPRLTEFGSHGQFYTQDEIRALVRYAADRGIRIVPEFDLPGHALSVLQGYPALAAASLDKSGGDHNPDTYALDPAQPATLKLVATLYGEMAGLFPDRYFHAGGDEVRAEQWTDNKRIVAYMAQHHFATPDALQGWFTGEVAKILAKHGKTMIGWDEVLAAPVPQDVAIDVWRSSKWIANAAKAGHPVVVSAGYYLDLLQPAAQHYVIDPLDPTASGLDAAQAAKAEKKNFPAADAFARDPNAVLPPEDAHLVLGGEAPLWAENVSDSMLDARLWPRAAAIAERFWSKADVRDIPDMQRRLNVVGDRLTVLGLDAQANRARMIARIAPGDTAPVAVLVDAAAPVRNYAINYATDRSLDTPVPLTGLAEIAQPDSPAAERVDVLTTRLLSGDHTAEAPLRAILALWHDNDAAFTLAAASHPALTSALPTSHALAALGQAGLDALDALDGHPAPNWRAPADAITSRLKVDIALSADTVNATSKPQPAADLLLPGVDPVTRLIDAAAQKTSLPPTPKRTP